MGLNNPSNPFSFVTITTLKYSDDFIAFLTELGKQRAKMVTDTLNDFAKGELDLDPRSCDHFQDRNKVLLHDANVVVYYDVKGDTLFLINGSEVHPRAA